MSAKDTVTTAIARGVLPPMSAIGISRKKRYQIAAKRRFPGAKNARVDLDRDPDLPEAPPEPRLQGGQASPSAPPGSIHSVSWPRRDRRS
ncbi:MAG: hypothetical protein M3495_02245 [Pseudomonadota bacterium]|nr:hypothetical protein [Gammaproteobacteria bacterium]MDQ3580506.1 hypothetical protein [Pseudomonadota bacterium]